MPSGGPCGGPCGGVWKSQTCAGERAGDAGASQPVSSAGLSLTRSSSGTDNEGSIEGPVNSMLVSTRSSSGTETVRCDAWDTREAIPAELEKSKRCLARTISLNLLAGTRGRADRHQFRSREEFGKPKSCSLSNESNRARSPEVHSGKLCATLYSPSSRDRKNSSISDDESETARAASGAEAAGASSEAARAASGPAGAAGASSNPGASGASRAARAASGPEAGAAPR